MTKMWMTMELFVFYSQLINTALFLMYIHLRGAFGFKNIQENANRYKFDALDYYDMDIEWVSFQFVPIGLSLSGMLVTAAIGRSVTSIDYTFMGVLLAGRVIQLFLMGQFRNQKRAIS